MSIFAAKDSSPAKGNVSSPPTKHGVAGVRVAGLLAYLAAMAFLFARPIYALMVHAANSDLDSYILLVPLITLYLLYIRRPTLPNVFHCSVLPAAIAAAVGLSVFFAARSFQPPAISEHDYLTLFGLSLVCCIIAGGFALRGKEWMRAAAFPIGFLFFMVPLPDGAVDWLENGSRLASAEAANLFFSATNIPFFRDGTTFRLPGITLEVARECSGIRSSWVLLLTTVLAANLFLETTWRRAVLILFALPLGILRNGFRILVIGWLCVEVGPHMVESPIHHRGGPVFFILSLIPLVGLLWALRHNEDKRRKGITRPATSGDDEPLVDGSASVTPQ